MPRSELVLDLEYGLAASMKSAALPHSRYWKHSSTIANSKVGTSAFTWPRSFLSAAERPSCAPGARTSGCSEAGRFRKARNRSCSDSRRCCRARGRRIPSLRTSRSAHGRAPSPGICPCRDGSAPRRPQSRNCEGTSEHPSVWLGHGSSPLPPGQAISRADRGGRSAQVAEASTPFCGHVREALQLQEDLGPDSSPRQSGTTRAE